MPDDPSKKRPQDSSRINVHEPWELEYWCKHFGVTPAKLKEAVAAVGDSVAAVTKYLSK